MATNKKYSDIDFKQTYNDVLKLVKSGHTIDNALNYLQFSRRTFYARMSKDQKLELQLHKTANAKYGSFIPKY